MTFLEIIVELFIYFHNRSQETLISKIERKKGGGGGGEQALIFTGPTGLHYKSFENTVRKGGFACNKQFLPQCFL